MRGQLVSSQPDAPRPPGSAAAGFPTNHEITESRQAGSANLKTYWVQARTETRREITAVCEV